ncbi:hypothetical protein [Nonlabens ponticola]|uniref:Uncharacterized protein n=1 Tax=Nonlabens ponticola TaxID=2496866 RepID=A0A3S9MYH0_9FLAO|nr:hypothetical protein [Nonlabens ponticola]AZQ44296.1 hypothetical protein EJ995_08630 [Nonlabens ponticola]
MNFAGNIPSHIYQVIDKEEVLFKTKNRWFYPRRKSYKLMGFALFWNLFVGVIATMFFGPLITEGKVSFTQNDVPVTGSLDDWEPLLFPALFIGLFVIVGLSLIGYTLWTLFKPGGGFIATDTRLISYGSSNYKSYEWSAFTGTIEVLNYKGRGSLIIDLRTGTTKKSNKQTVVKPDQLYLENLDDPIKAEHICRKQITQSSNVSVTF